MIHRGRAVVMLVACLAAAGCVGPPLITLDMILLRPFPPETQTPADLGYEYEDVFVRSLGGFAIHGWFVPIKDAPGTILIHPGIEGNVQRYLPAVTLADQLGMNVMLYDFQGFGRSQGPKRLTSLKPDGLAMMDWLAAQPPERRGRIVQMGVSFGTQVAAAVALDRPDDTAGLILEGSITPDFLSSQWMKQRYGALGEFLGRIGDAWVAPQVPPEIDAPRFIGELAAPKLFIQSPDDSIAPWPGALALYELAADPKYFFTTAGGHVRGHEIDPAYVPTVRWFLSKYVGALPVPNRPQ